MKCIAFFHKDDILNRFIDSFEDPELQDNLIELADQIINTYYLNNNPSESDQNGLGILLDTSLNQTVDHQTKELIKEIKRSLLTNLAFGNIFISSVTFSAILAS